MNTSVLDAYEDQPAVANAIAEYVRLQQPTEDDIASFLRSIMQDGNQLAGSKISMSKEKRKQYRRAFLDSTRACKIESAIRRIQGEATTKEIARELDVPEVEIEKWISDTTKIMTNTVVELLPDISQLAKRKVSRDEVELILQEDVWFYRLDGGMFRLASPMAVRLTRKGEKRQESESSAAESHDKSGLLRPLLRYFGGRGYRLDSKGGELDGWLFPQKINRGKGAAVYNKGEMNRVAMAIAEMLCTVGSFAKWNESRLVDWAKAKGERFSEAATTHWSRVHHQVHMRQPDEPLDFWLCRAIYGSSLIQELRTPKMGALRASLALSFVFHDEHRHLWVRKVPLCECSGKHEVQHHNRCRSGQPADIKLRPRMIVDDTKERGRVKVGNCPKCQSSWVLPRDTYKQLTHRVCGHLAQEVANGENITDAKAQLPSWARTLFNATGFKKADLKHAVTFGDCHSDEAFACLNCGWSPSIDSEEAWMNPKTAYVRPPKQFTNDGQQMGKAIGFKSNGAKEQESGVVRGSVAEPNQVSLLEERDKQIEVNVALKELLDDPNIELTLPMKLFIDNQIDRSKEWESLSIDEQTQAISDVEKHVNLD